MRVYSLRLQNFLVFRTLFRRFDHVSTVGITAEYVDDATRSNRAGKSTLIEAMQYALTGVSRAKREIELISHGQEVMLVELTLLDDDGKKYVIKRGRDIQGHGLLEVSGIEKKAEAQEQINQLIGLTPEEFAITNYFQQGETNGFMNLSSVDKKKHLMRWLKNEHWARWERSVLDALNEKVRKLAGLRAQVEALEVDQSNEADLLKNLKLAKEKLAKRKKRCARFQRQLEAERVSTQKNAERSEQIETIGAEIEETQTQLQHGAVILQALEDAERKLRRWKRKMERHPIVSDEEEQRIRKRAAEQGVLIRQFESWVASAEKTRTGRCPILDEGCDRIKYDKAQVKGWKGRIVSETKVREKYEGAITQIEARRHLQDRFQQAKAKLASLQGRSASDDRLEQRLAELRAKRKALRAAAAETPDTCEGLELQVNAMRQIVDADLGRVASLEERLKVRRAAVARIKEMQEKIARLEKRVADLRYVAFMFGKNGIPSQEIENAFDEIENEINFVLGKFGTGLQVQFQPDRELGSWEDGCVVCGWQFPRGTRVRQCGDCGEDRRKKRKDDFQLRVLSGGHDEAFEMNSGGGQALVSIAVRLANARLIQRQTGSKFDVLFLDEADAMLDAPNRQAFLRLITAALTEKLGFRQVFLVSHSGDIQESVPHVLRVVRDGDQSRTKWLH